MKVISSSLKFDNIFSFPGWLLMSNGMRGRSNGMMGRSNGMMCRRVWGVDMYAHFNYLNVLSFGWTDPNFERSINFLGVDGAISKTINSFACMKGVFSFHTSSNGHFLTPTQTTADTPRWPISQTHWTIVVLPSCCLEVWGAIALPFIFPLLGPWFTLKIDLQFRWRYSSKVTQL